MKKIMFALVCAIGSVEAFGETDVVTNVYDFTASLKVPYLEKGIRNYKSQTFKGYLFTEVVDGNTESSWLEIQNKKTKVVHITEPNYGFYHLMGKSTKYTDRSVPTIYCEASDVEITDDAHELISKIQFAGTGSLKTLKQVTVGCASCGVPTKTTTYCNLLYRMSGYATGVMDCQCPDDEDGWWHTVQTTLCGVFEDDLGNVERKHEAALWGTWSATFNSKLSDTKLK